MKKTVLTAMLALLSTAGAWAEGYVAVVQPLIAYSASKQAVVLTPSLPPITFDIPGSSMLLGQVIVGQQAATGIEDVKAAGLRVYAAGRTICIEHQDGIGQLSIFSSNGTTLYRQSVDARRTEIPMGQGGLYVVKVDGRCQKVLVK